MRVDPSTLTGVLATVEQLSQRGSVLAESTVPRFFNGAQIDALSLEATSMIADAKRARQLLGSSPVELLLKDRLAAMAHAGISASNTGAIKPTIGVLREFGRTARDSLRITLGDARAEIANSTDQVLVDIRSATPRNLATTAVDDLRAAIQLRDAVQLPPLTVGARPLYPFDLPVGDPSAHVRLLQRPHAQSQGLFRDLDAAARRIEEVVGPDPAALTTIDAAELRVLLETGPDATWALPRMVGSRPLVEVVDQLSRGMDDGLRQQFATAVTEHRATIRTAVATTVVAGDDGIRGLLDRGPATWSTDDWRALATALERDAAAGSPLGVPRVVDGARSVDRIIKDGIRGREGAATAMQRYVDAWDAIVPRADAAATAAAVDPKAERLVGELATILARDPLELQSRDLLRFRSLLDADRSGEILRGPRELRGAGSLYRALGDTGFRGIDDRLRYVAAWRTVVGPSAVTDTVRREQVHALLVREPETLTRDEWVRLGALVDGGPASLVEELRLGPELRDLGSIARRHGVDGREVDGTTRLAFATAGLALDELTVDTARLHGAMRDLVDRPFEQLGPNDWARMRALLAADRQREVLDGPRFLTSAPHADMIATSMMSGRDDMVLPARRLLAAWSAHMSGRWSSEEALLREARRFAARQPSMLTPAEWREFGTMLDVAGHALRSQGRIVGVDPLAVTAARAAAGQPIAMPQAERALRAWAVQFDHSLRKPGAMTAAVRELVDRDPNTLSPAEWRRLQSIVDFDTGWDTIGFPKLPDGVPSIVPLTEQGIEGRTVNAGDWNRVVEAWRLHADGVAADQPKLEQALFDALSPASGRFDDARIGNVRAILDADARAKLLESGRGGDLVPRLHAHIERHGSLAVEDPVVDLLRNQLDDTHITERRAAIRSAIDGGGAYPTGTTLEEIRAADPHWDARGAFEQLAREAQSGAHSSGKAFTSARNFLHRARDVSAPAGMPDPLAPLWAETRTLIDVNLERLAGRTPRGQVKGYSVHPDYAQVGRIKSNIELIHRIAKVELPATQPDQQVRRLGAAQAEGTLTW